VNPDFAPLPFQHLHSVAGYPLTNPAPLVYSPWDIVMTHEAVDTYGPSSYPYVLGSLSSYRPPSTESKATTTSACFFEVPNANQNDDLMVCSPPLAAANSC